LKTDQDRVCIRAAYHASNVGFGFCKPRIEFLDSTGLPNPIISLDDDIEGRFIDSLKKDHHAGREDSPPCHRDSHQVFHKKTERGNARIADNFYTAGNSPKSSTFGL
jgi:hypothetical protein